MFRTAVRSIGARWRSGFTDTQSLSAMRGRVGAFSAVVGLATGAFAARYGVLPSTPSETPAVTSPAAAPRAGKLKRFIRNRFKKSPHNYSVSTRVYVLEPGEDLQEATDRVYQALRNHAAPGGHGIQVKENPEGSFIKVTFLGTVNSSANPQDSSVTNQTQDDHWLHDGQVTRRVVVKGREIYIDSVGTGTGMLPTINEITASLVWTPVDEAVSREANRTRPK